MFISKKYMTAFMSFVISVVVFLPSIANACSSCGCTLSSDWDSQGYSTHSGLRFDLRYDYLNQDQLRSGTGTVDRSDYKPPQTKEIEDYTVNHYTTLGIDYSPNKEWGINLQIPYIDRPHKTVAPTDITASYSDVSGLGDIKLVGRYQGFTKEHNVGVQFGLKLPTGNTDDTFSSGPEAGEPLDRGLQAGTGTTDLILGIYTFGGINKDWDYFAQGFIQEPLNSYHDYKVGTSENVNMGVRYMAYKTVTPQLQVNFKTGEKDEGAEADADNSGGTLAYLSPGATVSITKQLNTFVFVQVPIYQDVNGFQLTPRYTASFGIHYSL